MKRKYRLTTQTQSLSVRRKAAVHFDPVVNAKCKLEASSPTGRVAVGATLESLFLQHTGSAVSFFQPEARD